MRPTQKSNRTRGRGNRKSNGNNLNRVYDSSGPEGKVRGTPQQIIDKYLSLARDAQTSGDRVMAENFLQHAEHYQRILLLATQSQQEQRRDQGQHDAGQSDGGQQDGDDEDAGPGDERREQGERGDRGGERRQRRNGDAAPAPGEGPQPEIAEHAVSGLTTIDTTGDTDGSGDTLLVATEETAASQPQTPRRRRPARGPKSAAGDGGKPAAETAAETTEAASDQG